MNRAVKQTLETIGIGNPQHCGRLTVFPLVIESDVGPEYLTMGEALAQELLTVTEINDCGSVPELKVRNDAYKPVLIVDGEELRGAKQNRVVNSSILLQEHSETIIPVSCTEQGRWHHTSPKFSDSDAVMARKARTRKSRSVHDALKCRESYRSDQGGVWEEVSSLHQNLGTRSPSRAMSDAYDQVRDNLGEALASFPLMSKQAGLLVYLGSAPMGLDLVSRAEAFKRLHQRLLKSYVIDVVRTMNGEADALDSACVTKLLCTLFETKESAFKPVGHGEDFRYENGGVFGSALVFQDTCIHTAFFWDDPHQAGNEPGFARFSQRRRNCPLD